MKGVIGIRNRHTQFVTERRCSLNKGYIVLALVLLGLARIPFKVHSLYSNGLPREPQHAHVRAYVTVEIHT